MASVIHETELSKMVAERLGFSQAAAADATGAVLANIGQALSENDRVTLTGFGTFSVRERAARQMRAIAGDNAGQMIDGQHEDMLRSKPETRSIRLYATVISGPL